MPIDKFGYTNDASEFARVVKWAQDAIKDGWTAEPTYGNESILSAARLQKDGWVAQVFMRFVDGRWNFCANVHVWAPDELHVPAGDTYDFALLMSKARTCQYCGDKDVDTTRMKFAGRACLKCREDPKVVAREEPRGWYD